MPVYPLCVQGKLAPSEGPLVLGLEYSVSFLKL